MKKKIVIDARMYSLEHGGIGRYVINLIREIRGIEGFGKEGERGVKFFLLVKREDQGQIEKELGDSFQYVPVKARHYSFREQWEIPLVLKRIGPDLVHFPHFNVPLFWFGRTVVTIHDMIMHYSRGLRATTRSPFLYWPKHFLYKVIFYFSVKKAEIIIVPSHFWKEELIKRYGFSPEKIAVTYEGADEWVGKCKVQSAKCKTLEKEKKKFLVYTGNAYPHKNLEGLFRALKIVNEDFDKPLRLYLFSSRSVFLERLEKLSYRLGVADYVKFMGFLDDEELVAHYQKAVALVQPSFLEGFGLTGLEAMAIGCPVIAANASCLPEVYQKAALYFDPHRPEDIAEKIIKVLDSSETRERLKKEGFLQARKYSWKKMAKETLNVYLQALK